METTIELKEEKINYEILATEIELIIGEHCDILEKTKNGKRTLTAFTQSGITENRLKQFVANHVYIRPPIPPVRIPRDKKAEWVATVNVTERIDLLAKELGFK